MLLFFQITREPKVIEPSESDTTVDISLTNTVLGATLFLLKSTLDVMPCE